MVMVKKVIFPLILLFVCVSLFGVLSPSRTVKAENYDRIPGKVLVKFRAEASNQEIDRQINTFSAKFKRRMDSIDVFVFKVPTGTEERFLKTLSRNPYVEYAEPDYVATALFDPNDPYFSNQWGLENTGRVISGVVGKIDADIDGPTAWDTTKGGVKVAILDCGINENHPDLVLKVVDHKDFTGSTSGTNDIYGHGTHVAGIVAAETDNGIGVAGVCPDCYLLNGKVLNDNGSGAYSWIANGIIWATDNGAKVINLSLGGAQRSTTLENAVNYAWNKGVVVVAAAGNSNNSSKTYPAAYTNAIAVAATDNKDLRAYFSSYGATWVDIAAPGVYVFSTWKDTTSNANPQPECDGADCYKYASGTSMSTPMVAGVAGLIWKSSYDQSASSVRTRMETTADKIAGTGTYWSAGRVNAANAVSLSTSPTDTESPTVSITSPLDGSFVSRGKKVTISATATDNVAVKKVEFYINGKLLSTDATEPYVASRRVPFTRGITYEIMAKAYDTSENTAQMTVSVTSR
ncbi:peptidase S8 [candidate division WWE3 bacterium CG_4_10_14_0_2_um_filter_42_7]|uniref:Peptidase S8 n=2 Tax=Katanobacteria TaxID=422282 RepID=A0A2H0X8U7_UNCKA|nr:MAG: peptidase S8 [candidate division WWE3 bacterium CG08_land_8_20_14_0_20_41_15]PIZ43546.1 MAG: peptidase S8 [candidate division WWE3 bacterium CG_4_10_14_0_2_um_filter_42_7]